MGAGELVINSIDNDGLMQGYDTRLISKVRESISIPLTVLGGAGSVNHLRSVIDEFGTIGVAAGSLFVFKGIYKAVLINYPGREEKQSLYNS
jgi:cyclase